MNRSYQYRRYPIPSSPCTNRVTQVVNTCGCQSDERETREETCDRMVLAMSYVLMQELDVVYEPEVGFHHGTIFPELNKPFLAGGMICG